MLNIAVCLLLSAFYTLLNSEIASQWYKMQRSFDNTGSPTNLQENHSDSLSMCTASCARSCGCFGYNSKKKRCRLQNTCNTVNLTAYSEGWRYYNPYYALPKDCEGILKATKSQSGIYTIYPFSTDGSGVDVYCDMKVEGGGWTAIQRRRRGSVNFNTTWDNYKIGFGIPGDTYWIGNDVIHQLTRDVISYLYINITLKNGESLYELYHQFSVADEADKYRLFLKGPATGTLGDAMLDTEYDTDNLTGMQFSTFDQHNNPISGYYCASYGTGGGWWYNTCSASHLHGSWNVADWRPIWNDKVKNMTVVKETLIMIKKHP